MDNATAKSYLQDLGKIVKEKALKAKASKVSSGNAYDAGYLMAFHETISLMQSQADAFGIPLEEIGLAGINPDLELL